MKKWNKVERETWQEMIKEKKTRQLDTCMDGWMDEK